MVDEVEGVGLQHFDTSPSYWCFGADLTSIRQRSGAEVYLREEGVCKVLSQNIIIIFLFHSGFPLTFAYLGVAEKRCFVMQSKSSVCYRKRTKS